MVYISHVSGISIYNTNNDVVDFLTTSGLVTTINWKKNGEILLTASLSYTDSKLTIVSVINRDALISKYVITYGEDVITLKDDMSGECIRYTFEEDRVTKIEVGNNDNYFSIDKTKITYEDNKSEVSDGNGNKANIIFDTEGKLSCVIDDKSNVEAYRYDVSTKRLLTKTVLPNLKREEDVILDGISLLNFTKSGDMSIKSETNTLEPYQTMFNGRLAYKLNAMNGSATYVVNERVEANTPLTLVLWVRQQKQLAFERSVSLIAGNQEAKVSLKTCGANNQFEPIVVGLLLKETVDSITIKIELLGAIISVGNVELYKKAFGSNYVYDAEGRLIGSMTNGKETTYEYIYNDEGSTITSLSNQGITQESKKDILGRLTKTTDIYGVTKEYTYDNKNRVLREYITNDEVTFENTMSYSNNDLEETLVDSLDYSTTKTYDKYGNILKVKNAINEVLECEYNPDMSLKELYLHLDNSTTKLLNATYEYDDTHHNRIKSVTLKNGSKYEYGYDALDRLTTIKLNGVEIIKYGYEITDGRLNKITHGGSEVINIGYNEGMISSITRGTNVYGYTYNNLGQVVKVTLNNTVLEEIEYDIDGNIVKRVRDGIDVGYKNETNRFTSTTTFSDNSQYVKSLSSVSRSEGRSVESLNEELTKRNERYVSCLYLNNDISLKNKNKTFKADIDEVEKESYPTTKDEGVACLEMDGRNVLRYGTVDNLEDSGTIGMWIKPLTISNGDELLKCYSLLDTYKIVVGTDNLLQLKVIKNIGQVTKTYVLNKTLELDKWTFIGISFKASSIDTKFSVMIDNELRSYTHNQKISMTSKSYTIGANMRYRLAGLMTSYNVELTEDDLRKYYLLSKEYIFKAKEEDILTSSTKDTISFSGYRLYPLNNNVLDVNLENGPSEYEIRKDVLNDQERTFSYNEDIKGYAYKAVGKKLVYNFENSQNFTIGMRVYLEVDSNLEQYIFQMYEDTNKYIGLFIKNKVVYLNQNGTITSVGHMISLNSWTFVGLTYRLEGSSYRIRVLVGMGGYEVVREASAYNTVNISIGRAYQEEKALYGQIEMLTMNNIYTEELYPLSKKLKTITSSKGYDEFNRLRTSYVKDNETLVMKKEIEYKSQIKNSKTYTSTIPLKETIYLNGTTIERTYDTDGLGRVKGITDSVFGNKTYTYDDRGYLTNDNGNAISYDDNGNIKTYGSNYFDYDNTVKDKIVAADGLPITYTDTNPLNPTSWIGFRFEWDGRRLSKVTYGNTLEFTYNEKGLRTKKTVNNSLTYNYYYEEDRLVRETSTGCILDYLYDENNMLYGLVYNKEKKYYYVKDILGNILGLVDESGNLVVKYSYGAYGNSMAVVSDTTEELIGSINPFRYKGYYYDKEVSIYYCKSRYYMSHWYRWLSPDSVEYLDSTNINGMNLYAYCGNDPVNCMDPSGHFAISALLIGMAIGFGVGALIGGGFEVGKQIYANGWNPGDWDWAKIGLAALGGGVAGAISAIPIPGSGFLSYLGTFAIGGVASVAGGLITGSVNSWETAALAFGIGGAANVIGRGISDIVKHIKVSKQISVISNKAQSIANMSAKNKSLTIWNMVGTDNFTRNAFKSWGYDQIFNLLMTEGTNQILINTTSNLTRYMLYSSIVSSLGSGWF